MRTTVVTATVLLLLTSSFPHLLCACASYIHVADAHGQGKCPHQEREAKHAHGDEPAAALSNATPNHACCVIQVHPDVVSKAVPAPARLISWALPAVMHVDGKVSPFAPHDVLYDDEWRPPPLLSLYLLHGTFLI